MSTAALRSSFIIDRKPISLKLLKSTQVEPVTEYVKEINSVDSSGTISALPRNDVMQQLTAIAQESNVDSWDGDGAKAIDVNLIPQIYSLLQKEPFNRLPTPEISAEPDGEINVGWFGRSRRSFSFSVNASGRIAYAMYSPEGIKFCGTGKLSDDLANFEKFIEMASS